MKPKSFSSTDESEDQTEPEESGAERAAKKSGPGLGSHFAMNVVAGAGQAVGATLTGIAIAVLVNVAGEAIAETQCGPHQEGGAAAVTRCV